MDDKDTEEPEDKEEPEDSDSDNLREIILQQLANLEQSDVSDDDSYKVRLSCILEDDESESSGTAQKDFFPKDVEKGSERNKESEKGPPVQPETEEEFLLLGGVAGMSESMYDSELSDEFACENVQITDLDDVTLCDPSKDKTEEPEVDKTDDNGDEEMGKSGFAIKKLKSSDNVPKRPFVVRRRELSSDSSDMDITTSGEGQGDLKIVEIKEGDDEGSLKDVGESEVSVDEEVEQTVTEVKVQKKEEEEERPDTKVEEKAVPKELKKDPLDEEVEQTMKQVQKEGDRGGEFDHLDNDILNSIFAKVSRTYLEKTKGYVKWEENEKIDKVLGDQVEGRPRSRCKEVHPGDHLSFQDVHIRGTSPREYNPPVPPETYLWEELKRLRERGGYPWTYLDKPAFDEATWKKYMEHFYEPINPPPLSMERKQESLPVTTESKYEPIPQSTEKKSEPVQKQVVQVQKMSVEGSSIPETEKPPRILPESEQKGKDSHTQQQSSSQQQPLQQKPQQEQQELQQQQQKQEIQHQQQQKQEFQKEPQQKHEHQQQQQEESRTSEDMEVERISAAQALQDKIENQFLAPTPTATTATTASQSRTDVTSSVLDTSGFEDLPIREGSLVKTRREQMREQAQEFQQRLRNHAGRIRNKFHNMPKPSIARKDRLKKEKSPERKKEERRRFHLPEMHAPKINLPDRSKFKIPEKAKFHLPESSRFHLPDRSKFHLPEKGKFHLPERPKLHLPERPKIHLPDRPKLHLPERPKIHLPDRPKLHLPERPKLHLPERPKLHFPDKSKFHLPEKAKFHLPDKSKFHLPERAKFNLPNRPKLEMPNFARSSKEPGTSSRTLKSRLDDLKSYPKLFTKHAKDYTTSSPKQTRGRTPPPRMKQTETPTQKGTETWLQKLDDLKYADDELDEAEMRERESRKSETPFEDYPDREEGYVDDFGKMPHEVRTISTKSSASRLSDKDVESLDDRKKGVLEEINSDEFFLRQKGISQDNIDVGKYLSHEIREAFRSPDVNALAKMDYMDVDDENADPRKYQPEPTRPKRSGSTKKKSILKKSSTSDPSIADEGYKTYPPRRPGRKSRSQSKSLLNEEAIIAESGAQYETEVSRYDNDDVDLSRYDNVEYEDDNVSEYYKTPGPAKEYQHYKVPRPHAPISPSPPVKRKSSLEEETSHKRVHEGWEDAEDLPPPKPMVRRKSKKKVSDELESMGEEQMPQEEIKHPEEVVPKPETIESPVPPKRTRTRSSGSRSLRSLATDDDVNRSFRSEPGRDRLDTLQDEIVVERRQDVEEVPMGSSGFMEPPSHECEITDLDDVGFGYATVGKPTAKVEQKKQKPVRPPPPRKKKEVPSYATYPKRTPVRPLRNYSTLGPSRPPRRRKIAPIEQTLAEREFRTYSEIQHFDEPLDMVEVSGSSKDLQTEKVIEKMKGRPLPPPPRPPRQKSKGPEEESEATEEEKMSLSILRDEEFPLERKVTAFVHEPPADREFVEETCASTQTDPLPDDFSFETDEGGGGGMIQEFSHEQLKIQQAFLEEMKREEEEMRERGTTNDMVDAELKAEVIRQIEDIIAEEKRMLEGRKNGDRMRREESERSMEPKKSGQSYLDVDADMGYASLDRKGHRQEAQSSAEVPPPLPPKMDKLKVRELDVETINVREVQADQIFVKELQSNRVASQDIDNTGGNMVLGNVDLPPNVIQQIVAKIPWDSLRQEQKPPEQKPPQEPSSFTPPVRPQRRHRGPAEDDSEEESSLQPRKTHRRHHRPQYSSDEEDRRERRLVARNSESRNIPELSLQLVRACTSVSVRAIRTFVQSNAAIAQSFDRELCVQAILCIAVALIAAFFLFGFDAKIVHLHRWDFQFPPQPPPNAEF